MVLHLNRPPDGMKNTKSGATQRAGASPLPPLDATRVRGDLQPATQHASLVCGDLQPATRHHAPYSFQGLPSRQQEEVPRPPGTEPSRQITAVVRNHHVTFPVARRRRPRARRPKMSPAPSSDVVPHRKGSAVLNTPPRSAADQVITDCRCR